VKSPELLIGLVPDIQHTDYLGELDDKRYAALRQKYTDLVEQRAGFSISVNQLKKFLDDKNTVAARKEELNPLYVSASQLLKAADVFIESLKASEASDKSPLFNAARYLAYENRTSGADILDFELRLEGLSITKENIFVGQRLRLSGVAFLTYRIYAPQGNIKQAKALRRIARPIEIDLKGNEPDENFWSGSSQQDQSTQSPN